MNPKRVWAELVSFEHSTVIDAHQLASQPDLHRLSRRQRDAGTEYMLSPMRIGSFSARTG